MINLLSFYVGKLSITKAIYNTKSQLNQIKFFAAHKILFSNFEFFFTNVTKKRFFIYIPFDLKLEML